MNKTILIIARHGNTFAKGDVITRVGKTDMPLVESGLNQGGLIGDCLKSLRLIPDIIFTSKLKRTIQTAEQAQKAIGISLPLESLDIFNEIDYGIDENQPEEKVVERLGKEVLDLWDRGAIVPQGWIFNPEEAISNWKIFASNMVERYQGKTILVVTSNGIARFAPYITGDFKGFKKEHKIKISTGALCVFDKKDIESDFWDCREWNLKPKEYLQQC